MDASVIDPGKYGKLCAIALPKVIEFDEEFDRMVEQLEALDRKRIPTREERTMAGLLAKLIQDYDNKHYPMPDVPGHEMVKYMMEQRGLRQADLVPVLGSRAQVSDLVNGKRGISKDKPRNWLAFFRWRPICSSNEECHVPGRVSRTGYMGKPWI